MRNPVIDDHGNKFWQNKKNELHRKNKPAVECVNGDKFWYQNGKLHRLDGPAVILIGDFKEWWINGRQYTEEEFNSIETINGKLYIPIFTL